MKNIRELIDVDYDFYITGITDDSRLVKEGYMYVATKGFNVDHFDYVIDAIKNGASFLVVDRPLKLDFPHKIVENINSEYRNICSKYYDINLADLKFIGVTGTDGKTTTTSIINNIIDDCAYLGTNGLKIGDMSYKTSNTTPCISELYSCISIIKEKKINNVVLEVSSEGLLHNRVDEINFDVVGFTNITEDHLNIHGDFENYLNCKLKLLGLLREKGLVVVNGDDVNLKGISCNNLYTFGFSKDNDFVIANVNNVSNYTVISVNYNDKKFILESYLKGKYNVYNVVMAFVITYLYGIDSSIIIKKIRGIKSIDGRGELLEFGQDYDIILDYAHTVNAVRNVLETFKNYSRIITVIGCAGGRDRKKRRIIGNIVMEKSDISIFTMDDPRFEDVNEILDEMVGNNVNYIRIINRDEAIKYALSVARKGDVVLILGKGRDNYMAINDYKIWYSDYEVIKSFFYL